MAGEYECNNIDLLAFVPLKDLGSNGDGNDIWGWTDPDTHKEYALVGCADGTSFVDVTEPTTPVVVGFLPTHTSSSLWRDLKVVNSTCMRRVSVTGSVYDDQTSCSYPLKLFNWSTYCKP